MSISYKKHDMSQWVRKSTSVSRWKTQVGDLYQRNNTNIRPCPMVVLNATFNMWFCSNGVLKIVEWWCGWERCWNHSTMLNLQADVRVACFGWEKMVRVQHASTNASGFAGGGVRICFLDNMGHVFSVDWLSGFLSF